MTRIIPGVQVTVVKEVVPPQLAPSGVLGVTGVTENDTGAVERAASWSRFVEVFGPGSAYSMPEAKQALQNGVFELVVSPVAAGAAAAARATVAKAAEGSTGDLFELVARSGGTWANDAEVQIAHRAKDGEIRSFDLKVQNPATGEWETHRDLGLVPGTANFVGQALAESSGTLKVDGIAKKPVISTYNRETFGDEEAEELTIVTGDAATVAIVHGEGSPRFKISLSEDAGSGLIALRVEVQGPNPNSPYSDLLVRDGLESAGDVIAAFGEVEGIAVKAEQVWPREGTVTLAGGADPSASAFGRALSRLVNEADVDMVLASVPAAVAEADLVKIHSAIIAHCKKMSADSKGRVGFGQVPPDLAPRAQGELATGLVSDRFVLVSPHGTAGAVAGLIGSLPYYHSPTFKTISGLGALATAWGIEDQRALLKSNVVPVVVERGRGMIVLRGLTTDGDQISVRRVADRAVRGVKMIGELFIGQLNSADGRAALKQKLAEFLLQMEKDGAIVPSTDGTDPSFKLDVYSSQADFAKGIVRVDVAVRPVRAIDYIYATILVQV